MNIKGGAGQRTVGAEPSTKAQGGPAQSGGTSHATWAEKSLLAPRLDQRVLLIGAGALARDIAAGLAPGFLCAVFVEPGFEAGHALGLPLLQDWAGARAQATHYVLGLLDAVQRQRLHRAAQAAGLQPVSPLVSPSAGVSPEAVLAPGCVVGHNVQIGAGAQLGRDVLVLHNAVVAHDVFLGDNTVVLPGAWIGGYVRVGAGCFIGANSVISPGLQVGEGSVLAPGAACMKNLAPGSVLIGNPGRVAKAVPRP